MIRNQTNHQSRCEYAPTQAQHIKRQLTQRRFPIRESSSPHSQINEEYRTEQRIKNVEGTVEVGGESVLVERGELVEGETD